MTEITKYVDQINSYIAVGEISSALQLITEKNKQYSNDIGFLKAKANLCVAVGEFNTATNIFRQVQKILPTDVDAYKYFLQNIETKNYNHPNKIKNGLQEDIIIINSNEVESVIYEDDLNLYKNRECSEELLMKKNRPLVSIYFLAYNNLKKYTKIALECILKYTKGIDYELILVDNGSTDGTFEYFKSIQVSRKRIYRITKNLGAGFSGLAVWANTKGHPCNGKYFAVVPNDVFVTANWLENMIVCMESDESIAMVVPMSDNVSNYQAADIKFHNFEEMQEKAAEYNISNPLKWEERIRIIPTAFMCRKSAQKLIGEESAFIYYFGDDDLSFRYRRAGYKLMVCGDVFVHHEGTTAAVKDTNDYNEQLRKGRIIFKKKYYGIDAWNDVNNYEFEMVNSILDKNSTVKRNKVLGVDVACGMPLLQIKNDLRKKGITDVILSAYTENPKYWLDLSTICEGDVFSGDIDRIQSKLGINKFDYIFLGQFINAYSYDFKMIIKMLMDCLKIDGRLVFKFQCFGKAYSNNVELGELQKFADIALKNEQEIKIYLQKCGYKLQALKELLYLEDENRIAELAQYLRIHGVEEENVKKIQEQYICYQKKYIIVLEKDF